MNGIWTRTVRVLHPPVTEAEIPDVWFGVSQAIANELQTRASQLLERPCVIRDRWRYSMKQDKGPWTYLL